MKASPTKPEVKICREACIACGACYQLCPTDVFRLGADGKPIVEYPEDCQACFLCEYGCPTVAIDIITHRWIEGGGLHDH